MESNSNFSDGVKIFENVATVSVDHGTVSKEPMLYNLAC